MYLNPLRLLGQDEERSCTVCVCVYVCVCARAEMCLHPALYHGRRRTVSLEAVTKATMSPCAVSMTSQTCPHRHTTKHHVRPHCSAGEAARNTEVICGGEQRCTTMTRQYVYLFFCVFLTFLPRHIEISADLQCIDTYDLRPSITSQCFKMNDLSFYCLVFSLVEKRDECGESLRSAGWREDGWRCSSRQS